MEKKLENISKLADDIVLTEQNERKLFIAYKKRIESQRRKKVLMRGYISCSSSCISYDDNVFCKLLPAIS